MAEIRVNSIEYRVEGKDLQSIVSSRGEYRVYGVNIHLRPLRIPGKVWCIGTVEYKGVMDKCFLSLWEDNEGQYIRLSSYCRDSIVDRVFSRVLESELFPALLEYKGLEYSDEIPAAISSGTAEDKRGVFYQHFRVGRQGCDDCELIEGKRYRRCCNCVRSGECELEKDIAENNVRRVLVNG